MPTRRRVIEIGAASLATGLVAGCTDDGDVAAEGAPAQASFFLVYDFARAVAGDRLEVESVVPFGQHGHGWEPTGQVQQDVYDAPLFAYVGEGFQPWADDVVASIRSDGVDVEIVETRASVDLLPFADDHEHADHGDENPEHREETGHEHDGETGHSQGSEHDHGGRHDPHFWLDPLRAKTAVDNLRDGFQAVDPDGSDGYDERAASYKGDLEALHETFSSRLADAPNDTVLVAGHNAFRYLGDRYGFEIVSLSGLSPDEEPSAQTRRTVTDAVAEHDVQYILAPALESTRAAEQLVAETNAEGFVEISALSGRTEAWRGDEWGYLEIMRNVNLPALKRALGVE